MTRTPSQIVTAPTADAFDDFETGTNRSIGPLKLWRPGGYDGAVATVSVQTLTKRFGNYALKYSLTSGTMYLDMDPNDDTVWSFLHQNMVTPNWTQGKYNRMGFWVFVPSNVPPTNLANRQSIEFGTYTRKQSGYDATDAEDGGWHFYHFLTPLAGVWTYCVIDPHPQHSRQAGGVQWVGNPGTLDGFNGNLWPTTTVGWNYFDAMTRFYVNDVRNTPTSFPADYIFDDFRLFNETDRGDIDHISTLESSWNPATNLLHLGWCRMPEEDPSFEARWSLNDMQVNGFNSGTVLNTVGPNGNGAYVNVKCEGNVNLSGQAGVYLAVKRVGQTVFRQTYHDLRGIA